MRSEKIVKPKSFVVYNTVKIKTFVLKQPICIDCLVMTPKKSVDPKSCFVFYCIKLYPIL